LFADAFPACGALGVGFAGAFCASLVSEGLRRTIIFVGALDGVPLLVAPCSMTQLLTQPSMRFWTVPISVQEVSSPSPLSCAPAQLFEPVATASASTATPSVAAR